MGQRTRISNKIIEQAWALYNQGLDSVRIANKLDISNASAMRCITAMSIASSGKKVEYTGLFRDSHHIADYANQRFKDQPNGAEEQTLIAAIQNLAACISKQNTLLETLIKKFEYRV